MALASVVKSAVEQKITKAKEIAALQQQRDELCDDHTNEAMRLRIKRTGDILRVLDTKGEVITLKAAVEALAKAKKEVAKIRVDLSAYAAVDMSAKKGLAYMCHKSELLAILAQELAL